MTLNANGKRIDCSPIAHLFSQGERYADKVAFALSRYYEGQDLSGCTFALTSENAQGKQAQQVLEKAVTEDTITAVWQVTGAFTVTPGPLGLSLRAYRAEDGGSTEGADESSLVLEYQLTDIEILPTASAVTDPATVTLAQEALNQLAEKLEQAMAELEQRAAALALTDLGERIAALEGRIQGLTQAEYEALTPDTGTLYLILPEEGDEA
ncbi:hypothetical protein [Ruminococcus sp.]|uniref:hypothetical protein n=1 Tax=Ruminococcus sp. TaxID=41978 RepID=UPI00260642AD|nr:hypothetical protein [Ruminococcus sp.]MDD7556559.1 hypothetical protein [Ruminococcus sp.]